MNMHPIFRPGVYAMRGDLIVPQEHGEKYTSARADIVLDPVCGSGTSCFAAAENHCRFIGIDLSPHAVEIAWNRLTPKMQRGAVQVEWLFEGHYFEREPMLWDAGCSYIVRGDAITVLRSMPDSFVELVCVDPPFNANREFRNKDGVGFSDIWKWNDDAEERLEEIRDIDLSTDRYIAGKTAQDRQAAHSFMFMTIEASKLIAPDRASYMSWCALLLMECRRVMGAYERRPR